MLKSLLTPLIAIHSNTVIASIVPAMLTTLDALITVLALITMTIFSTKTTFPQMIPTSANMFMYTFNVKFIAKIIPITSMILPIVTRMILFIVISNELLSF